MKFALFFGLIVLSYCCVVHGNEAVPENRVRRSFDDIMKVNTKMIFI